MKRYSLLLLAAAMAIASSVASGAEMADGLTPKALFEKKCGACHPPEKAVSVSRSRKVIEDTILRMKSKKPDVITDEEAKIVADYILSLGTK